MAQVKSLRNDFRSDGQLEYGDGQGFTIIHECSTSQIPKYDVALRADPTNANIYQSLP